MHFPNYFHFSTLLTLSVAPPPPNPHVPFRRCSLSCSFHIYRIHLTQFNSISPVRISSLLFSVFNKLIAFFFILMSSHVTDDTDTVRQPRHRETVEEFSKVKSCFGIELFAHCTACCWNGMEWWVAIDVDVAMHWHRKMKNPFPTHGKHVELFICVCVSCKQPFNDVIGFSFSWNQFILLHPSCNGNCHPVHRISIHATGDNIEFKPLEAKCHVEREYVCVWTDCQCHQCDSRVNWNMDSNVVDLIRCRKLSVLCRHRFADILFTFFRFNCCRSNWKSRNNVVCNAVIFILFLIWSRATTTATNNSTVTVLLCLLCAATVTEWIVFIPR